MKKILYVASTYGHIDSFHLPYLQRFKENGFKVDVAAKGTIKFEEYPEYKKMNMPFEKRLFSPKNLVCTARIKKLIQKERYEAISVHTSLAAFYTRLAVMLAKGRKPMVVNTVHGYLFEDKPTNIKQYIKKYTFLLAENITRSATNVLFVMNDEDFEIAKKYRLYKDQLIKIPGMGIDTKRFSAEKIMQDLWDSAEKGVHYKETNPLQGLDVMAVRKKERLKLELRDHHVALIYAAEFSDRKNQKMLIEAMTLLPSNVRLYLAGRGKNLADCIKFAKELGVGGIPDSQVTFLGQVKNMENYYFAMDACVSASKSEGLPFNVMESMSIGLPIIATDVKGHRDLVKNGVNGFLYEYNNKGAFAEAVKKIMATDGNGGTNAEIVTGMREINATQAKAYEVTTVMDSIMEILAEVF